LGRDSLGAALEAEPSREARLVLPLNKEARVAAASVAAPPLGAAGEEGGKKEDGVARPGVLINPDSEDMRSLQSAVPSRGTESRPRGLLPSLPPSMPLNMAAISSPKSAGV
jgi:hypothetical protein